MSLAVQIGVLLAIPVLFVLILTMARYRRWRADHATGFGAVSPSMLAIYPRFALPMAAIGLIAAVVAAIIALGR